MKRSSYCLCVAIGLLTGTFLSAQEYRDAVAFGLKGNVRECTVQQENGSSAFSPYDYSKLSFDKDGKLGYWRINFGLDRNDRVQHLSNVTRSGGFLTGFKYSLTSDDSEKHCFHYKEGELLFHYLLYSELDSIFGYTESTKGYLFSKVGDDSFVRVFFSIDVVNDAVTSLIEKNYGNSVDLLTALKLYAESSMSSLGTSQTTYKVLEKDAHGNFTKLVNTETGRETYQTITYWDTPSEPAAPTAPTAPTASTAPTTPVTATAPTTTTSAPTAPSAPVKPAEAAVKPQAPKPAEETAGFRPATPKDLSFEDIVTRPFGVLPTDRRRCSQKQILSDLSSYGWKVTERNGVLVVDKTGGYDMAILGEIPYDAGASFFNRDDRPGELYGFYYSFVFKTAKQAKQFAERMISYLRSEGVEVPEPSKHSNEVSAMYGSSIVELKLPKKGNTYMSLYVYYWGGHYKDGKWETGWVE